MSTDKRGPIGGRDIAGGSEVVVTLADDSELNGTVESFNPQQPAFHLRAPGAELGTGRRLEFAHVKRIAFRRAADAGEPRSFPASARLVTVRFLDGTTERGVAENFGGARRGIYLVPPEDEEIDRVYLPISAVREVVSVQRLGDILTDEGLASREAVRHAIERQEELRKETLGQILIRERALDPKKLDHGLRLQREKQGKKIGEILLEQGFIGADELRDALALQQGQRSKRLGDVMIEMGLASHKMIGIALSIQYNVPFVAIDPGQVDPRLRERLPAGLARRWRVMPIALDGDLFTVAVDDPTHWQVKDALRAQTGCIVTEVVATPQDIARALGAFYGEA